MASLPSLQASLEVATGKDGVIEGKRVKRFVDLSTVGSQMAVRIHDLLAKRNIVQLDSPVSGGVGGAEKGTLAVMVSGPKADCEAIKPALDVDRQGVLHRREARLGADHEARQQLVVGNRGGRDLRGRGDGRQVRPRSERDDRGDQFRIGHEHGKPRQVSALDPAAQLRLRLYHRP